MLDAVVKNLTTEEGYREHVYQDTEGHATIGYGFNLDAGMPKELAAMVARYQAESNLREFAAQWPPYHRQPFAVRVALADMAFQLGPDGLLEFHDMLAAIERGDWRAARTAARDSDWHRETPERAEAVIAGIR